MIAIPSSLPNCSLKLGPFSTLFKNQGCHDFHEALKWVWKLPYGRTSERNNYALLFSEKKGACSNKHGLIQSLCEELKIPARLVLVICKLDVSTDIRSKPFLEKMCIPYLPEAHTYIEIADKEYDFTFANQGPEPFSLVIKKMHPSLEELKKSKISTHQTFLKTWIKANFPHLSYEKLWSVREDWIRFLGQAI